MSIRDKKVAIFVENIYEDLEFWYPYYRLKEAGATVTVVAPERGTYKGKHGLPAEADTAVTAVGPGDFDALVIPGGYSPDQMRRHEAMVEFVKGMHKANKPIAAICHAGWMLASADIIEGKNVTSFFSIRDDMRHAGADWVDKEVVVDGNLITSRQPDDLPAFCQAIIQALMD